MIVYIKCQSGKIYASPVFAEIGKNWDLKSVVLNETNTSLILLPLRKKGSLHISVNYFYIDETIEDGWQRYKKISGFPEIIQNKILLKALKQGKQVSIDGLDIIKQYHLPLPVVNHFEIKNEQDISTFNTVCWGLHDASIEGINQIENDIIINFNTNWGKHIIITYHNVKESRDLDCIACVLNSIFKIGKNHITWELVGGFDLSWNGLDEGQIYIIAQSVTWELKID